MLTVKIANKGHFCNSEGCNWWLHHHVNGYCVSSIGDWHPEPEFFQLTKRYTPWTIGPNNMVQIGLDRWFETMLFPLVTGGCVEGVEECNCPHGTGELCAWGYKTQAEAEEGHMGIVHAIEDNVAFIHKYVDIDDDYRNSLASLEMGVESQKEV